MKRLDPVTGEWIEAYPSEELLAELREVECECAHQRQEIRTIPTKSEATQIRNVCLDCGKKLGNALAKRDFKIEPELLDAPRIEKAWNLEWQTRIAEIMRKHAALQKSPNREFAKDYSIYLKSEEWKKKRNLVLKRADYVCEGCGLEKATEVHHLTYERRFAEMLFDLRALCATCHSILHSAKTGEIRGILRPLNRLCDLCRWHAEFSNTPWCSIFDLPADAALASTDACNNGKSPGFEGLK